jgi:hypothetical protein
VNDTVHVRIRTRHISSPAGNNVPTDGLEMALFGLISLGLRTLTSVWGPLLFGMPSAHLDSPWEPDAYPNITHGFNMPSGFSNHSGQQHVGR